VTDRLYTVTELAEDLGITARAVRFYETKGLIKPQRVGATRVYTHRDRGRLKLILRGKRLGFSLAEIREFLDLYVVDTSQVGQLRLLRRKVRERRGTLERQREDLDLSLDELAEIERLVDEALAAKGVPFDDADRNGPPRDDAAADPVHETETT